MKKQAYAKTTIVSFVSNYFKFAKWPISRKMEVIVHLNHSLEEDLDRCSSNIPTLTSILTIETCKTHFQRR
eukprot:529262-Ditylum_brightwellii.AAC.1